MTCLFCLNETNGWGYVHPDALPTHEPAHWSCAKKWHGVTLAGKPCPKYCNNSAHYRTSDLVPEPTANKIQRFWHSTRKTFSNRVYPVISRAAEWLNRSHRLVLNPLVRKITWTTFFLSGLYHCHANRSLFTNSYSPELIQNLQDGFSATSKNPFLLPEMRESIASNIRMMTSSLNQTAINFYCGLGTHIFSSFRYRFERNLSPLTVLLPLTVQLIFNLQNKQGSASFPYGYLSTVLFLPAAQAIYELLVKLTQHTPIG